MCDDRTAASEAVVLHFDFEIDDFKLQEVKTHPEVRQDRRLDPVGFRVSGQKWTYNNGVKCVFILFCNVFNVFSVIFSCFQMLSIKTLPEPGVKTPHSSRT